MADRAVRATRQFRKDFRRAAAQGRPLDTLRDVMEQIAAGERLSEIRPTHPLKGDYADCMERHLAGDWLLIWREAANGVVFVRVGSHADLFG